MKTTLSVILCVIMAILTLIGYSSGSAFAFAGGSISSVMNIVTLSVLWPTLLFIILIVLIIVYLKTNKKWPLFLITVFMLLWILSGRIIGILIAPEGKIVEGWFYIETGQLNVCDGKDDCESTFYYQTKLEELPFWRVRIKNASIDKTIFVGPFIWNKTLKVLKGKHPGFTQ